MRPWVHVHTTLQKIMHCSVRYADLNLEWSKTWGSTTTQSIHIAVLEYTGRSHNCTYLSLLPWHTSDINSYY